MKTIYQSESAHEAWTIARHLHISYVYVDAVDRGAYAGAGKFAAAPQFFTPAFVSGEVAVYSGRNDGQPFLKRANVLIAMNQSRRPDLLAFLAAARVIAIGTSTMRRPRASMRAVIS